MGQPRTLFRNADNCVVVNVIIVIVIVVVVVSLLTGVFVTHFTSPQYV